MLTREQLEKALKKNFSYLTDYILDIQKELNEKKEQLAQTQDKLLKASKENERLINSPVYVLGQAIGKYVDNSIKKSVENNIGIEVNEKWAEYDEEQTRPDYEANVYWKEKM